jgi:serine protease Do
VSRWRPVLAALLLALVVTGTVEARTLAWLGVRIRDLSEPEMDELATKHGIVEGFGVMIVEVMDDTPAARAGMHAGDIVVAFEGRPVTETRLLMRLISRAPIDHDVRLTVLRSTGRKALLVRLVDMPRPVAGERIAADFGFVLRDAESVPDRLTPNPPLVTFVVRNSPAERGGLEKDDVILQINERAVLTRDAAREALSDVAPDQPLHLTVRRDQEHVTLTLSPPSSN